jgi:methylated-DNA-protein-cysteine methyltransferase related protein
MPKSEAFVKIKADILQITKNIPAGRTTTFSAIGDYLNVVPRHVAYILSTLSHEEADDIPWHRVVPANGVIKTSSRGAAQKMRLESEGSPFTKNALDNLEVIFLPVKEIVTWERKQGCYL